MQGKKTIVHNSRTTNMVTPFEAVIKGNKKQFRPDTHSNEKKINRSKDRAVYSDRKPLFSN